MRPNGKLLQTAAGAAAFAGVLSGIPSTAVSLLRGGDPLAATVAAGSILLPREERRARLLAAAIPMHMGISFGWALLFAAALPRRRTLLWGAGAGLAIAALDLGPLARPFPRIRALPLAPQVADHLAFGALAAYWIERVRRGAPPTPSPAP